MIYLFMDSASLAPSQGPLIEAKTLLYTPAAPPLSTSCSSPSHRLYLEILSFMFLFFYHFHFLSTAFVPAPFLHSFSFFPCAQMIPRYSSYSPEDALIPPFSTSVDTPFQKTFEDTMTKQIYKGWVEFRILFMESCGCVCVYSCLTQKKSSESAS